MIQCKCGSYAINHHLHGRDGSEPELCDVCYWRKKYERNAQLLEKINSSTMSQYKSPWAMLHDIKSIAHQAIED